MSNGAPQNSNTTANNITLPLPPGVTVTDQLNTIIELLMKAQTENGGRYSEKMEAQTENGGRSSEKAHSENRKSSEKMHQLMQGSLMVVAVLAAGATYQAGLSPPGGLWQADDNQGHAAGKPILQDTYPRRYKAFFYCNSVAFTTSLVLIILLMNREFYRHPKMLKVLHITMVLDMFGFMGAYAAGSCREFTASVVLLLLMGGVFIQVIVCATMYSGVELSRPCAAFRTSSMDRQYP